MSSTIGRRPVAAAPTPAPMNPASEIGGVEDALGAEFTDEPLGELEDSAPGVFEALVFLAGAPATSSPITITEGSRSISWVIASFMDWTKLILLRSVACDSVVVMGFLGYQEIKWLSLVVDIHVGDEFLGVGPGAFVRKLHRLVQRLQY